MVVCIGKGVGSDYTPVLETNQSGKRGVATVRKGKDNQKGSLKRLKYVVIKGRS